MKKMKNQYNNKGLIENGEGSIWNMNSKTKSKSRKRKTKQILKKQLQDEYDKEK